MFFFCFSISRVLSREFSSVLLALISFIVFLFLSLILLSSLRLPKVWRPNKNTMIKMMEIDKIDGTNGKERLLVQWPKDDEWHHKITHTMTIFEIKN